MPFLFLSLFLTRISMKWRALICVHSYFAFYFSSCECLCILFSCLVLSCPFYSSLKCRCLFWEDYEVWSATHYAHIHTIFCPSLLCCCVAMAKRKKRTNQCMRESEMKKGAATAAAEPKRNELWKWNKFVKMGWILLRIHTIYVFLSFCSFFLSFFRDLSHTHSRCLWLSVFIDRTHTER